MVSFRVSIKEIIKNEQDEKTSREVKCYTRNNIFSSKKSIQRNNRTKSHEKKIENKVLNSRPTTNYINNSKSEWVKHLDNRQRLSDGIKTKIQLCDLQDMQLRVKDTNNLKGKGWRKYIKYE